MTLWRRKLRVLFLISALSGCSRQPDPVIAFDHAWQTFQSGELVKAQAEAEEGARRFSGAGGDWSWKFTILSARVLHQRGMDEEALKMLAPGPDAPLPQGEVPQGEVAIKLLWLKGILRTSLHDFPQADRDLSAAEQRCQGLENFTCEDVSTARGQLEAKQGRYAQAQTFFARVLASARANKDQIGEANALLDLSWSAEEQAHFDEALDWSDAAQRIAVAQKLGDVAEKAVGNKGWAYYKLGDTERAEAMFLEAQGEAAKLGQVSSEIGWLTDAGYVYADTGRPSAAEKSFQDSLKLARQIGSRGDILNSLIALALLSEQTDKLDDAKRYADEALARARDDKNGRDQVYPRLVQGRIAARLRDAAAAESAFREVGRSPDTPVFLKWEAERSLARLYEGQGHADSADGEYRKALSTFETARSELKREDTRLPFLGNASRIYDDYIHFLVAQGKPDEALRVAAFSRGRTLDEGLGKPTMESGFKPDPLHGPAVARRVGATILFYWLGAEQSYLWAITAQKASLFALPAGAEIEAAAERYRQAILGGHQDVLESADADGQYLYRALVAPVRPFLKTNAKVLIIPDGSLNNLNFETLLAPGDQRSDAKLHYWMEDATIAEASSLRVVGARETPANVADSVSPSDQYPELAEAGAQLESVARYFPAATEKVLTRQGATPLAYLDSHPETFSYIHFVAHGKASRLSPLDSMIVLSKNGGPEESFKLYARDIVSYHKLHPMKAKLVTVSACYSAGERAYSGEGLVGLSWAFLRAGARNVVAALWDATDAPTLQLMDKFYDELNRGSAPDVALRNAKLALLHGKFRSPFYWAPFQLYRRMA